VSADDIAKRLAQHARALQHEIHLVADLFQQTDFLGDINNLPHAHYGYLMATVGQIDTVSVWRASQISDGGPNKVPSGWRMIHAGEAPEI